MIEPLYHQTVAGKKTMTRRSGGLEWINENLSELWEPTEWVTEKLNSGKEISVLEFMMPHTRSTVIQCAPRYKVDDILYLKEPYIKVHSIFSANGFGYKFGQISPDDAINSAGQNIMAGTHTEKPLKFKNKLFMPAAAARAFIRITSIKCERLLDISDADCISEGIHRHPTINEWWINYQYPQRGGFIYGKDENEVIWKQNKKGRWRLDAHCETPKESFLSLYKFANKVKEIPNIWVWAYSYEYLTDYEPGIKA